MAVALWVLWFYIILETILLINRVTALGHGSEKCSFSSQKHLNCSGRGLTTTPAFFQPDVEMIDLSRNNITKILRNSFKNLTNLEKLDLSFNNISSIEESSFELLPNLRALNLWSNKLSDFNLGSGYAYHLMKENFVNNPNSFCKFQNLSLVDLQNNSLSNIGENFRKSIDQLKNVVVKLKGNPFLCNCAALPSIKWLNQSKKIEDFDELHCSTSTDDGKVLFIRDFATTMQTFCDNSNRMWIKIVIVISFNVFVINMLIVCIYLKFGIIIKSLKCIYSKFKTVFHQCYHCIYCRYKIIIRYWSVALKLRNPSSAKDFEFTVFVYYNYADWKDISPLYHYLRHENIKICIPDIDFIPGTLKAENIIFSTDHSKKVLLFITDNFLDNEWTSNEKRAVFLSLERKRTLDYMQNILINKWTADKLTNLLDIKWPEDDLEKALIYALRRENDVILLKKDNHSLQKIPPELAAALKKCTSITLPSVFKNEIQRREFYQKILICLK